MPHASTGTQHSCPGASGPVTLKNGNIISAGNCSWQVDYGKYRWCTRHENICRPHDWTYSKKDECKHCQKAKQAKREEAERKRDEKRKRKRDKDDDDKKRTPKKKDGAGEGGNTPARTSSTPSVRKTRSSAKKESGHKGDKQGGKKAQHWHIWLEDTETISFAVLFGDDVAVLDQRRSLYSLVEADGAYREVAQDHADLLTTDRMYLSDAPEPTPAQRHPGRVISGSRW